MSHPATCPGPYSDVIYDGLGLTERSCSHGWSWVVRDGPAPTLERTPEVAARLEHERAAREERRARQKAECRWCAATIDGTPCARHGGPVPVERNRDRARAYYHARKRRALAGA